MILSGRTLRLFEACPACALEASKESEKSRADSSLEKLLRILTLEAARAGIEGLVVLEDAADLAERTRSSLSDRRPLSGAGALHGSWFAKADLLLPSPAGPEAWDLVIVRGTASLKESQIRELAYAWCVFSAAGVKLERALAWHVDRTWLRPPPGMETGQARGGLFRIVDLSGQVRRRAAGLPAGMAEVEAELGLAAARPHRCVPPPAADEPGWDSVFNLYQGGQTAASLAAAGVRRLSDVPPDEPLSRKQRIQVEACRRRAPFLDEPALRAFLARLEAPVAYLDFEAYGLPVPAEPGMRPWEHVPFGFALATESPSGLIEAAFVARPETDGRPQLLASLRQALSPRGSLVVYNRDFESKVLSRLAEWFPSERGWLVRAAARLVDLNPLFREFKVYFPAQGGSVSLKKVLPALTGRGYSDLEVGDGGEANRIYTRLLLGCRSGPVGPEGEKALEALRSYVARDGLALHLIVEELRRRAP